MLGCGRGDAPALTHDADPGRLVALREPPMRSGVGPIQGIFEAIFFKPNDVNR